MLRAKNIELNAQTCQATSPLCIAIPNLTIARLSAGCKQPLALAIEPSKISGETLPESTRKAQRH